MSNYYLLTADVHFNEVDYQKYPQSGFWQGANQFFRDLETHVQVGSKSMLILGDLTDAKDRHSGKLVNFIVNGVDFLHRESEIFVSLLFGNHDGLPEAVPFFDFLLECGIALRVIWPIFEDYAHKNEILRAPIILFHGPVKGFDYAAGQKVGNEGIDPVQLLSQHELAIGGDLHKPLQRMGNILYCGSPYDTRYGKEFERHYMVLVEEGEKQDLGFLPGLTLLHETTGFRVYAFHSFVEHGKVVVPCREDIFGSPPLESVDSPIPASIRLNVVVPPSGSSHTVEEWKEWALNWLSNWFRVDTLSVQFVFEPSSDVMQVESPHLSRDDFIRNLMADLEKAPFWKADKDAEIKALLGKIK